MKRLLVSSFFALPLIAMGCGKESICTLNDADCDGVPDDLGQALDLDGVDGPDPVENDQGQFIGWAVDLNCDGQWRYGDDALGLDDNGDGYIDSINVNPDGEPVIVFTGTDAAVYENCNGNGGDGDAVPPGDGDGTVPPGDGDGDNVVNPWDEIPDVERGDWHAPIVSEAASNLGIEYARWKNFFLKDCGGGKLAVPHSPGRTVSEGMGYGMLITAGLGTQAEFDGMWATYRDAPKSPGGLMQWDCNECVTSCTESNAASDADLDAAMALLQAEVRFGGGTYIAAAKSLIGAIRAAVLKNCSGSTYIVAGEWDPNCGNLNPSYHAPGYYRAFARVDSLGAGAWNAAIDAAYAHLSSTKNTGPNTMWPDASPSNDTCFSCNGYDACRVPWRVATDYAWTGEPRAVTLLNEVSTKVDSSGFGALSTDPNSAFYGALATSGLAGGQAKADSYYSTWINSNPLHDNQYYQGTLRMIYLMLMAGQFPSTLPSTM